MLNMNNLTKLLIIIILSLTFTVYYFGMYLPQDEKIIYIQTNITSALSNVTTIPSPDSSLINILLILLSLSVIGIVGIFVYILIKRGIISKILGKSYIEVYIIGKDRRIRRYKKAIRSIDSKLTPVINKRKYLMIDRLMFLSRNNPSWIYREGNPKPLEINENVLEVNISDQELNDAIESKVVADLLKLSYVGLEKLQMILLVLSIGVGAISLYYMFNINANISAIIDFLISQQPNPTDAVIVPNIP